MTIDIKEMPEKDLKQKIENIKAEREKKVFDVLQKKNLDLMEKLQKATEALRFYAYADVHKYHQDNGEMARECLKEIE